MPEYTQGSFDFDNTKPKQETIKEKYGSEISPSSLETIIHYHELYNDLKEEQGLSDNQLEKQFVSLLNQNKTFNEQEVLKNAKDSIIGTHLHHLSYYQALFYRAFKQNRLPTLDDIEMTFPFRKEEYYNSMLDILNMSLDNYCSESPFENSTNFWNTIRFNGQDFKNNGKSYRVSHKQIKKLWEADLLNRNHLEHMEANFKRKKGKYDPTKTFVMNEVPLILNTHFDNRNFQIVTSIDEIRITPSDTTPIHIIDYKTGKQFKRPSELERLQIFLMMLAVYTKFVDKIYDLGYITSDWDLRKKEVKRHQLQFENKKILKRGKNIKSIESWQVYDFLLSDFVKFSYVEPITHREIPITLDSNKLTQEEGKMNENQLIFHYCNKMDYYHRFYLKYKEKGMRAQINGSRDFYCLPKFPSKKFVEPNVGMF